MHTASKGRHDYGLSNKESYSLHCRSGQYAIVRTPVLCPFPQAVLILLSQTSSRVKGRADQTVSNLEF